MVVRSDRSEEYQAWIHCRSARHSPGSNLVRIRMLLQFHDILQKLQNRGEPAQKEYVSESRNSLHHMVLSAATGELRGIRVGRKSKAQSRRSVLPLFC